MSSLTAPKKEQLRSFYYDVLKGGKLEKTWQRVQREFPGEYTRKQVKEFIDSQASAQETKQFRRNLKNFTSIHAKKAGEIFQIDLMFFSGGAVGPQRWAGALVCVDVYSRYAWAELVKQDPKPKNHNRGTPWRMARAGGKGQKSVLDAFKAVLQRSGGRVPKHVNMDEGNEFTNNLFQSFLQEKGITPHYSNKFTFMKNPIAERFNRTLRDAMREFKATGKSQFEAVKALQDIVKNYNRDVHSTTKERPVDVWRGKRENQQKRNNPEFNFGEGDRVRLLERQSDFRKSGKYKWSKTIYTIYDVQRKPQASSSNVSRYYLRDENGPLTFVDKADKQEKPAWVMGYQLQPVGKAERPKGYKVAKAKRVATAETTKQQQAKQQRALAKEGLDDAQPVLRRQPRKRRTTDWQQFVGKRVAVKWNSSGQVYDDNPIFEFQSGNIIAYNPQSKIHTIVYDDTGPMDPYSLNLANPQAPQYVNAGNWKPV